MYLISDGGINLNTLDTIEAIMLTKNISNLDGVKLDVRKSLDNVFVLSKYNDLDRLTYSNKKVNESTYAYLRKVKFTSHIFKYFIPTLEEVLKRYNKEKIIAIELFDDSNLEDLYNILVKYHYHYFFISKIPNVLEELSKNHFNNLGKIVDNDSNIQIIDSVTNNDLYDNTILILEK